MCSGSRSQIVARCCAIEYAIQAQQTVHVDIATLQVPDSLLRVEARSAVQQSAIVEHHEFPIGKQEADLELV